MVRAVILRTCLLGAAVLAACSSSTLPVSSQPSDASHHEMRRDGTQADAREDVRADGPSSGRDAYVAQEGAPERDAATTDDAGDSQADASSEAASWADAGGVCEYGGAPGDCVTVSACGAMTDHMSFSGHCPGPADIQCCIVTPSTANNPPTPAGYMLMQQAQVTSDMTTWAVMILNDPTTYPMFSTTTKTFATQPVLARVEWHPPDFQNSVVHRGVTLYIPV